jgi:hypothetical protein
MFYKFENEEWVTAKEIHFPDGVCLCDSMKIEKDGWKWYDNAPNKYIEYLKDSQELGLYTKYEI